ncbi:putative IEC3 subunit of the Ino80 complex, chromatin re-modelling-domain-containing protein [Seiridium cardinale]
MDDRHIKAEPGLRDRSIDDARAGESKPTYKSYKKKYRKLRLQFDQRVQESEDLHKMEQKALRTVKRLAIENDRLMEVLLDINESPQIPPERKINLDADGEDTEDEQEASQKPTKSLRRLVNEVPHQSFAETVERFPDVLEQLQPEDPDIYPTAFLTAADIDNYLADVDMRLGLRSKPAVPTAATDPRKSATNFALRNPTSVYNWLRRHAPKTFLQDLEKDKDKDREKHDEEGGGGGKRKSGAARGNKRQNAAHRKEAGDSIDWEEEVAHDDQPFGSVRGKRKRDDDGGYRPKGGSSRPTKRRARKSGAS